MSDQAEGGAAKPRGPLPVNEGDPRSLLAAIVESSEDAIASKTLEGIVTSWNAGAQRVFGYSAEEMIGTHISRLFPAGREDEEPAIIERIRAGQRVEPYDTIRRRKDGTLIHISLTVSPIRDANGTIVGASKIARDISERKRLEEAQRLLSREVNHRSKNLLAVVEAIIRQTVSHTSPMDYPRRISQRVRALSANQDLLIEGAWRGADLRDVVRSQLLHIEGAVDARLVLDGEALLVTPVAAQALGLAFHELAMNALSYGALSGGHGQVAVSWHVQPGSNGTELLIDWQESGGPAVTAPEKPGFGTTIIERITGQSLGGEVTMTYAPGGLTWALRAPLSAITGGEAPSPAAKMDIAGK